MIGTTLSHYRIISTLGQGGMGKVYEAEDTELRRQVALKVLPEEMASDPERLERFKREARAVAALNHPNIVTIHSVEEADGHHFLTMELVDGEPLNDQIPSKGLELDRFFELAIPIADALSAAHDKGVIHRDLKPANVMVSAGGRVKIVDFGLAKLWQETAPPEETELATEVLTREGVAMGTAPYMSPEQLQGKEVDHRSDLFSLGILLYEMALGQRPFAGESSADLASSILRDTPDSVTDLKPELPRHLARIIRHCLEKDPDLRYQSAKDVRNELAGLRGEVTSGEVALSSGAVPTPPVDSGRPKWLVPAAIVAAILAIGAFVWLVRGRAPAGEAPSAIGQAADRGAPEGKKIVVLPFENLGAAEDEYFAGGITEEISSRLSSVKELGVISRSSAIQYDRTGKTLKQVGEDLGVGYVLEGTVRWAKSADGSSRVRVTPQLIRVEDDTQLWAESYDRTIDDIFQVQSEIASNVLQALDVALVGGETSAAVADQPTDNLDAYQAYLRGVAADERYELRAFDEDARIAVQMFERAVELDPAFALAWAKLSESEATLYFGGVERTDEKLERALAAAQKAIEIEPELPAGHYALGRYYYWGPRDYKRALEEYAIAERGLPNDAELKASVAYVRRRQGQYREAAERLEQAVELNPRSLVQNRALATTYMALGRYEEADRQFDHTLSMAPDYLAALAWKTWNLLVWKGDALGAARLTEPGLEASPPSTQYFYYYYLYLAGDHDAALDGYSSLPGPILTTQTDVLALDSLRGDALRAMGKDTEARQAYGAAVEVLERELIANPDDPRVHSALGRAYAALGRAEEAVREGERAVKLQPVSMDAVEGWNKLIHLAKIHALLDQKDESLEVVDQILANPQGLLSVELLKIEPDFDGLRGHPRYAEILRKHS